MFGRNEAFYVINFIGNLWLKLNQSSEKEIHVCLAGKIDTREICLKITLTGITLIKNIQRVVSRAKCISPNPLTKRWILGSDNKYATFEHAHCIEKNNVDWLVSRWKNCAKPSEHAVAFGHTQCEGTNKGTMRYTSPSCRKPSSLQIY